MTARFRITTTLKDFDMAKLLPVLVDKGYEATLVNGEVHVKSSTVSILNSLVGICDSFVDKPKKRGSELDLLSTDEDAPFSVHLDV